MNGKILKILTLFYVFRLYFAATKITLGYEEMSITNQNSDFTVYVRKNKFTPRANYIEKHINDQRYRAREPLEGERTSVDRLVMFNTVFFHP
jgi:hypothetical protein